MQDIFNIKTTRQQELAIAAALSVSLAALVIAVSLISPKQFPSRPLAIESFKPISVFPDFASITDINVKKQQFFDFVQDHIDAENVKILDTRRRLLPLAEMAADNTPFSEREREYLNEVSQAYSVDMSSYSASGLMTELLERVDVIPPSLVLAQAANESAWGTSRFAVDGNNLFGQWCYEEGCGIVPRRRASGATHEVKRFDNVAAAVEGYFLNINTNNPYSYLRELRSHMRNEIQPIDPMVLAFGLGRYSERGDHYVDEVQNIIIQNDLTERDSDYSV